MTVNAMISPAPSPKAAPRGDRRAKTRARLLLAAKELFEEKGYVATTIDDIAARARTSRPTFYLHFDNKFELEKQLVTDLENDLLGLYRDLAAMETFSVGSLTQWIDAFLSCCERQKRTVFVVMSTPPADAEVIVDAARFYQSVLKTLGRSIPSFALAASEGNPAIRARAFLIIFQLEALLRYLLVDTPQFDRAALVSSLANEMLAFIALRC